MSKCKLSFHFKNEQTSFFPGERIVGELQVQAKETTFFDILSLSLGWETQSKGQSESDVLWSKNYPSETWEPGEIYSYPFDLVAPNFPFSYDGKNIKVRWKLDATAKIPLAFDVKEEVILHLCPKPEKHSKKPFSKQFIASEPSYKVALYLAFLPFIGLLVALIGRNPPTYIVGTLFVLAYAQIVFYVLKPELAAQKVGDVSIHFNNTEPSPSEEVTCRITFQPKRDIRLRRLKCELQCDEKTITLYRVEKEGLTREFEEKQRVKILPIFRKQQFFLEGKKCKAGELIEITTTLQLPEHAALSFATRYHQVEWLLCIQFDLPFWPDWEQTIILHVIPPKPRE